MPAAAPAALGREEIGGTGNRGTGRDRADRQLRGEHIRQVEWNLANRLIVELVVEALVVEDVVAEGPARL